MTIDKVIGTVDSLGRKYSWEHPPGRKPAYEEGVMTERVSIRLTPYQKKELQRLAVQLHMTYHALIRTAIDAYLSDGGDKTIFQK